MAGCHREGRLIGGCKWTPVYNTKPVQMREYCPPFGTNPVIVQQQTFAGAVCTRCGKINKESTHER